MLRQSLRDPFVAECDKRGINTPLALWLALEASEYQKDANREDNIHGVSLVLAERSLADDRASATALAETLVEIYEECEAVAEGTVIRGATTSGGPTSRRWLWLAGFAALGVVALLVVPAMHQRRADTKPAATAPAKKDAGEGVPVVVGGAGGADVAYGMRVKRLNAEKKAVEDERDKLREALAKLQGEKQSLEGEKQKAEAAAKKVEEEKAQIATALAAEKEKAKAPPPPSPEQLCSTQLEQCVKTNKQLGDDRPDDELRSECLTALEEVGRCPK